MKQTQQPRLNRVRRAGLFLLAFAAALPGCAAITNFAEMRTIPTASPQNPVADFACIWQQGEGRDQRGRPCRGFCGQLMFQTAASKKPGIVRGAVTIYVFDNQGTLEEQTKPFQVFEFNADEWASFQRKTNLGMTYQLFVPYTRPGGREAECQLHVKFTPEGYGTPIFSHPETIQLRGTSGATAMADSIDRKLMSSSPLFRNPTVLQQDTASAAVYADMVRRLQAEQQMQQQAAPPSGLRPAAAPASAPSRSELDRLQAILDASTTSQVQQASHADEDRYSRQVTPALYEELDDAPAQRRR